MEKVGELPMPELPAGSRKGPPAGGSTEELPAPSAPLELLLGKNLASSSGSILS